MLGIVCRHLNCSNYETVTKSSGFNAHMYVPSLVKHCGSHGVAA